LDAAITFARMRGMRPGDPQSEVLFKSVSEGSRVAIGATTDHGEWFDSRRSMRAISSSEAVRAGNPRPLLRDLRDHGMAR
jgi:hypothetical protein